MQTRDAGHESFLKKLQHKFRQKRAWFIKLTYKYYIVFGNEVKHPFKLISLLFLAIATFVSRLLYPEIALSGLIITGTIFFSLFGIYFLIGRGIKNFVRNKGGDYLFSTGGYFVRDGNNPCKIVFTSLNEDNFKLCTIDEIDIISELNFDSFKGTVWYTKQEEKRERNLSHFKKNDKCFLLSLASDNGILCYTHILPVNQYTWHKYKDGLIEDAKFYGDYVTNKETEYRDDIPFGLIIFSAAVGEGHQKYTGAGIGYRGLAGLDLTRALAFHISEVFFREEFKYQKIVPVMFQTMSSDVINATKDLVIDTKSYSKDGARIVFIEIENNFVSTIPKSYTLSLEFENECYHWLY